MTEESQELTFAFKNASLGVDRYYCLSCAIEAIRAGDWIINVILEKRRESVKCHNCGRIISKQT